MATYNPYTRSSSLLAGFDEVDYVSTIRMKSKKINGKWKWEPATMQNKFDDLPLSVKHLFQKVIDGIFGVWLQRSKDNDVMRFFFLCKDDSRRKSILSLIAANNHPITKWGCLLPI